MLLATSKVHELFRAMHEKVSKKRDFDAFAAILRELIDSRIISGKMELGVMFEEQVAQKWFQHVHTKYGHPLACEFYLALFAVPKDFKIRTLSEVHWLIECVQVQPNESKPSRKEKWMQLMLPLAKEFDTDAELLEGIYALFEAETTKLKPLLDMGKALFDKSASW